MGATRVIRKLLQLQDVVEADIADGQYLVRDGDTIVGADGSGGGVGSQTFADVLENGGDPEGNPVTGQILIQPAGAGDVIAAIIKANAAQSVDLTQWQDSDGTVVGAIDLRGLRLTPVYDPTTIYYPFQLDSLNTTAEFAGLMRLRASDGAGGWLAVTYVDTDGSFTHNIREAGSSYAVKNIAGTGFPIIKAVAEVGTRGKLGFFGDVAVNQQAATTLTAYLAGLKNYALFNTSSSFTTVALSEGGTGAALVDPNADRFMFWDDSAGAVAWLTPGTGLTITGTTVDVTGMQPLDSDLTAIAALTTTSYGRALLALADAAALRTAGGLVIGTDVEAHDADLTTIAGLTPTNDDFLQRKAGAWANRTVAQVKTDLSLSGTNTGDQTSVTGNAGTATALQNARTIDGQSFDGTANITVIAPGTHAATGKTTPVDADELALVDSAASNVLKKLTWANLKATLKTYFDTFYVAKSLYDANTILTADTDDTPAALTVAASRLVGRKSTGNIAALTVDEILALLAPVARQPGYVTGEYYPCGEIVNQIAGAGTFTVNQMQLLPFFVYKTTTFDRIGVYLTANGSAGAVARLGIFNDNNGEPGTLLLDAGTVATDTGAGAIRAITISQQLTPGRYWAAFVAQTASGTFRRTVITSAMHALPADWNGYDYISSGVSGALASNPTVTRASVIPPVIGLRAA